MSEITIFELGYIFFHFLPTMCSVDNITTFGQNVFETAAEGASVQNIDMRSEFSCKKDQIAWGENNWVLPTLLYPHHVT